jgi:3-oxoacyl-[acyl-carrier protein] reductase
LSVDDAAITFGEHAGRRDGQLQCRHHDGQEVQADITNGGGHAMFVTGDVTKFADIEAIRAHVEQTYGLVDVLVACAGGSGSRPGPIEDIGEDSWRADLDANLTATFLTIKSFLPA